MSRALTHVFLSIVIVLRFHLIKTCTSSFSPLPFTPKRWYVHCMTCLQEIIRKTVSTTWKDILLRDVDTLENVSRTISGKVVCPLIDNVFSAFTHFDVADTRVVILGQDPYHTISKKSDAPIAHGLAFSSLEDRFPPSLRNIVAEINGCSLVSPNLTPWCSQGVLLLNASLTVFPSQPNCHANLWSGYTDAIISHISSQCNNVVFMLWGNFAKGKASLIDGDKHLVLSAGHPSPLSVRHFRGCNHFTLANEYLTRSGKSAIKW